MEGLKERYALSRNQCSECVDKNNIMFVTNYLSRGLPEVEDSPTDCQYRTKTSLNRIKSDFSTGFSHFIAIPFRLYSDLLRLKFGICVGSVSLTTFV
jgi:hypothetical protein